MPLHAFHFHSKDDISDLLFESQKRAKKGIKITQFDAKYGKIIEKSIHLTGNNSKITGCLEKMKEREQFGEVRVQVEGIV